MSIIEKLITVFRGTATEKPPQNQDSLLLERHQVLVENLAAALVIRNSSGAITYCSPFTEVLCGYPLKSIYQSETDFFLSIVHPGDRDSLERALRLAALGESFQMRHRFFHHSDFEMWIESRTAPLFDEQQQLIASLTIMLDVTRAVRFEEQLQEKNQDLQHITSVAAEEIQNEVFTLKGMVALLDDGITTEEFKVAVNTSGNKLNELAKGLTEFGKASAGKSELRTISIGKVLETFAEEQRLTGVEVSVFLPEQEPRVIADKEEFMEVLSALSDYSRSLCQENEIPRISLEVISKHSEITVFYRDSCPPIPAHLANAIFRPSTNVEANFPSYLKGKRTPFSLSLTRKRMQRMGGGLDFRITEEGTNCFILSFRSRPALHRAA